MIEMLRSTPRLALRGLLDRRRSLSILFLSTFPYTVAEAAPVALEHWAFRAPTAVLPPGDPTGWSANPIDAFVRASLAEKGVEPAPEADRRTLARRVSLDLTGLLPSSDVVGSFVQNTTPGAYEALVDSLLTSPHYGERWGRHWLDLARYADSAGFEADPARPAWIYRDWVVAALNRNQPFDEFAIDQIAGDLLPKANLDQRIATGFQGVAPIDNGVRHMAVMNRLSTTGTVFLGLTLGCAQCHDHKTDPISQREYYQLYAFLNDARLVQIEVQLPDESEATRDLRSQIQDLGAGLERREKEFSDALPDWIASLDDDTRTKLSPQAREALKKPVAARSEKDRDDILQSRLKLDQGYGALKKELAGRQKEFSLISTAIVMKHQPTVSRVFQQGNHKSPGDVVKPAAPKFLHDFARGASETANRLDLARWLVSPDNPLTARVTVNRIWQRYFGLGLVETENDFGVQTPPPTHPALLDWLAVEFVRSGWDLKHIHRLIVRSATYRQSSRARPELTTTDPRNRWLARQNRLRLEAEIIRDAFLQSSGLIAHRIGGPSVYPHQPAGLKDFQGLTKVWTESQGADRYRRGLYTWLWRKDTYPLLDLFDASGIDHSCTRRDRSTTPVQALSLLNDAGLLECARSLGARVLAESRVDPADRADTLFELCLGRPAGPSERQVLLDLLAAERAELGKSPEEAKLIAGAAPAAPHGVETDVMDHAVWTIAARVVLNLDEFITRE